MRGEDMLQYDRMKYNEKFHRVMWTLLLAVELLMILVYLISHTPGKPTLERGYLAFYLCAIGMGVFFLFPARRLRENGAAAACLRYLELALLLLWGCLFSAYDVRHGNGGAALPQLMLFTSAGIRLPLPPHFGLNIGSWALYLLLLAGSALESQTFYSEAINSGIYLLIACAMIYVADTFQREWVQALRKVFQLQDDNLNAMAERVRDAQAAAEEGRIIRHDLRHVALALRANLACGNEAGAMEIVRGLLRRTRQPEGRAAVCRYTGVPELDAPLSRCAEWARQEGVSLSVALEPPGRELLPAFTLVLMNALENACAAVGRQEAGAVRALRVVGEDHLGQYYFEVENTYPRAASSSTAAPACPGWTGRDTATAPRASPAWWSAGAGISALQRGSDSACRWCSRSPRGRRAAGRTAGHRSKTAALWGGRYDLRADI